MATMKVEHSQIKVDPAVLPRTGGDDKLIKEYTEIKRMDKDAMPPPVVFWDEAKKTHWLADGDKRLRADRKLELTQTVCDVRNGDRDAAIWFACQANLAHGTRMTSAHKRQAIDNCLRNGKLAKNSDYAIAEACGASPTTVGTRRKALSKLDSGGAKSKPGKRLRKTKSGKTIDTAKIGRKKKAKVAPEPVESPVAAEDGLGNPVPEWLMDVWADVPEINAYLTSLTEAVVTPIQRLHGTKAGTHLDPKHVTGYVNEIRKHVRDSAPWSVCPECRAAGRILKSCKRCKGKGWLTRPQQDARYAS